MKHVSCIIALAFVAAMAAAVPMTASWIEGKVELRVGSAWKEVYEGDTLDSASVVRLGPNSLAEFSSGARKVALSSEGTYNLDNLLNSSNAQAHKTSTVVNKLSRVVDSKTPRSTVVAGVRGDFEGAPEKTIWAVDEDDPETLAEEGRILIDAERYADAAERFSRAADEAIGQKRDEYRYAQAWSLAAANDLLGAIKVLRPMEASGYYAVPRAILLARLNLDTGAPKEAAAVLDTVAANPALSGEDAAMVKELREEARLAMR